MSRGRGAAAPMAKKTLRVFYCQKCVGLSVLQSHENPNGPTCSQCMLAKQLIRAAHGYREFAVNCTKYNQKMYREGYAKWTTDRDSLSLAESDKLLRDFSHHRSQVSAGVAGIALADRIIEVGEDRITAWATDRAESATLASGNRARAHKDGDYSAFLEALGLYDADVPDNGSILASIAKMVDVAAGITGTTYYY